MRWPQPELLPGEQVLFQVRANLTVKDIARGGTLTVTEKRFLFQPNNVEARLMLRPRTWAIDRIIAVGVASRSWGPVSGAWVRRLRLEMSDGSAALFVVPDVESVVRRLEVLIWPIAADTADQ